MTGGELLLICGSLLACGIAAAVLASRIRVPGLLLFFSLGMLLGSDGLGLISFGSARACAGAWPGRSSRWRTGASR